MLSNHFLIVVFLIAVLSTSLFAKVDLKMAIHLKVALKPGIWSATNRKGKNIHCTHLQKLYSCCNLKPLFLNSLFCLHCSSTHKDLWYIINLT